MLHKYIVKRKRKCGDIISAPNFISWKVEKINQSVTRGAMQK
jgi:hypothetical protein